MSIIEATTAPRVFVALLFLLAGGVLEPLLEYWVNRLLEDDGVFRWFWEHVLGPLARAIILVGFALLAYPALFGVREAPVIAELLAGGALRMNTLIGILFICSLLLPLLTLFADRSLLLLPLQGIIATAVIFGWYTHDLGATSASLWPGLPVVLTLVAFVIAGHRLALALGRWIGSAVDERWNTRGGDRLVLSATEMLVQAPVILLYGYALGQQVAI